MGAIVLILVYTLSPLLRAREKYWFCRMRSRFELILTPDYMYMVASEEELGSIPVQTYYQAYKIYNIGKGIYYVNNTGSAELLFE